MITKIYAHKKEFLNITQKINEIIDYINKQEELAASTGNSSRITPNNGETPTMDNPVASLDNLLKEYKTTFNIDNNEISLINRFLHWIKQNARTTE